MLRTPTTSRTTGRLAAQLAVCVVAATLCATSIAAVSSAAVRPSTTAPHRPSATHTAGAPRRPHDSGLVVCVSTISGTTYNVSASLGGIVTLGGFQPNSLTGTCTLSGSNSGDIVVIGGLGSVVLVDGFENDGTIDLTGDDLTVTGGGTFTNAGTFIDESPGFSQTLSVANLVNTGTITAVEPGGATSGPELFLVAGTSGSSSNVLDNQATVSAGAGGTIDVENGTFVLEPTGTVTAGPGSFGIGGGGTFQVNGGTVTGGAVAEDLFLGTCIQAVVFSSMVPSGSTGAIAGSCAFTLQGTVATGWTIDAGGSITATPGSGNNGSIVLDGDNMTLSSTGTFANTGTIADQDAGFVQQFKVADFVNSGTVSAAEPAGSTSGPGLFLADGAGDVFENEGTVAAGTASTISVQSGIFQLDEGGSITAGPGSFGIGTNGGLVVDGGTVTGGAVQTFEFLGTCATTITFGAEVPADSSGMIDNVCPITLSGTIATSWTLDTTSSIHAIPGAANAGTLDLMGNTNLLDSGAFTNTGDFEADGGFAQEEAASFTCSGAGVVDVLSAELDFTTAPTNLVSATLTGCTWIATGRLYLNHPVSTLDASVSEVGTGYFVNGGADALSSLTAIGTTGSLSELGGDSLSISGSLVNDGTIALASTSSVSVAGTLDESSTSSLHTGVKGSAVGSIAVAGAASIAGDLQATLDGATQPALGAVLPVITAASATGSVSTQELASLRAPDFFWVAYPSTGLALEVVDEPQTRTVVGTSGTPSAFGSQVTFTATVTGGDGGGTVGFFDGGAAIPSCASQPLTVGAATCVLTDQALGSHSITATYSGDEAVAGSASAALTQVVSQASTSTVLGSSDSPSAVGSQVTFTATVTGSDGGGSVAFFDGASAVGACQDQTLSGGDATCVVTGQSLGTHSMTAVYSGDTDYEGSSSTAFIQVVDQVTGVTDTATDAPAGPIAGGDQLRITGSGFSGATAVLFVDGSCTSDAGSVSATVAAADFTVSPDGTTITLTSPSELTDAANECAGTGLVTDVVVTASTAGSAIAVSPPRDTYTFEVPQVASVTDAVTESAAGPVLGGEQLTISGTELLGVTKVSFQDAACTGDAGTTSTSVGSSGLEVASAGTSITLTSPGDALDVANACAGTAGIVTDVIVTVGSGATQSQVISTDAFTFELPVVAGVVDTASTFQGGPIVGGNELVVYGSGLTGATKVQFVLNGTVEATVATSGVSDTGVAITAPDFSRLAGLIANGSSSLSFKLIVELPDGHAPGGFLKSADGPYDELACAVPVVTSVRTTSGSATSAPLRGGESLTLHGTGLLGVMRVAFTYRDAAGATASLIVPPSSNTEDGTMLRVVAPNFGALVGISGTTALKLASGQKTVAVALRIIDVNPTTSHTFEGAAGSGSGFSLTVPALHAPSFTSKSTAPGTKGHKLSLVVATTGWPNAKITVGSHPSWLKLHSLGNGTATITGTPTKSGTVKLTLTAKNGVGSSATQHLTITVEA